MTVKITSFEAENVKRIKAVQLYPTETGLTIIGGDNNQGKTSVLDAIAWALGGARYRPSNPKRDRSALDPHLRLTLSNGLIVERSGKNSDLKVTDPSGRRSGQQILNSLIGEMALNIPKFMAAPSKEKAEYLLKIIGAGDQLKAFEKEEADLASERQYVGREYRAKKAHADELKYYSGVPDQEVSASDLIARQQEILLKNAENAKKRSRLREIRQSVPILEQEVSRLEKLIAESRARLLEAQADLVIAEKDAMDLFDESTEAIEKNLQQIDQINTMVRSNKARAQAQKEADEYKDKYQELNDRIDNVRLRRTQLLNSAPLPLPELTISDGEICYKGQKWDGMSGSDQLKVSAAICRRLNPNCGFVLLDKLEQMDLTSLKEFGQWLESEGLQAIATRVSQGDECSVIIEDGTVKGSVDPIAPPTDKEENAWVW